MTDEKQDIVERLAELRRLIAREMHDEYAVLTVTAAQEEITRLRSVNAALVEALAELLAQAEEDHLIGEHDYGNASATIESLAADGRLPAPIVKARATLTAARTGEE